MSVVAGAAWPLLLVGVVKLGLVAAYAEVFSSRAPGIDIRLVSGPRAHPGWSVEQTAPTRERLSRALSQLTR